MPCALEVCNLSSSQSLADRHVTPSDSDYRDRLELKSTTDRTLGVGVVQSESTLLILTAATMMKVTIDLDNVLAFDPQYDQSCMFRHFL